MLASCLGSVLVHFCWDIWQRVPAWKNAFAAGDRPAIEADILKLTRLLATEVMAACLSWHLDRKKTWQLGKKLAQKQGVESQGARDVRVTLATGRQIIVRTPYLLPRRSKRRDYRRLPGSRRSRVKGSYPLLKRLGFVNRRSLLYCQEVAQAATLCPSLEVTKRLLASRGRSRVTRSALRRRREEIPGRPCGYWCRWGKNPHKKTKKRTTAKVYRAPWIP